MLKLNLKHTLRPNQCNYLNFFYLTSFYKLLLPAVILLMAAGNTFSQNCNTTFEGNVISSEGNAPLEAAVVEVVGTDKIVTSSASGYFKIERLCPSDIIKLKISHLNCPDYFSEIDLNKTSFKNFYLDHKIQSLDEILIVDNKLNNLSTLSLIHI